MNRVMREHVAQCEHTKIIYFSVPSISVLINNRNTDLRVHQLID